MHIRRRFFVTGWANERLGESVILIIEGKVLGREIENALLHSMSEELHPYAIPKSIYYLPAFHLTPTHKIARKANLETLLARLNS
jgi:acyl-CoA synthetase (AMP-forming)/AMP-acid ligase II